MSEIKTVLILGGAGFVGRAVTEKYLKNKWRVIISTRTESEKKVKDKLMLHGFDEYSLEKFISNKSLSFIFGVDLTDKKWIQSDNWLKLFDELNVIIPSILRIINLVGETSKSADEILKSNIYALESIFTLVRILKLQNKDVLFMTMGSTAERKSDKNLSPYEYAKKIARRKIEEDNLCDFHFIANYIKGKGEQKMKLAAPILWNKLKFSRKHLFGFKVSIIDVDDLADIIYHLLEVIKIPPQKQKPVEVNVTNGEMLFGEMVQNLLPKNKRNIPKMIVPADLERFFLWVYATVIPFIKPHNQLARRLASFAKRSLINSKQPEMLRFFKTAKEIKGLALAADNYTVLETNPNLIVFDKHYPVIYILRERSKEELERIVRGVYFS
ncbi:MAG TPA: NAD-dependent epimerase/dehydratase family protein [Candidatus Paceibacterota bacterium]|nr:NAD-dependent epimerase/dehydratase family protein [Candidatus Paceibacterota bacterium]